MPEPKLGPVVAATLISRNLDHSIDAYAQHFDQQLHSEQRLTPGQAQALGWAPLAGARVAWMANRLGEPWLRIIEHGEAEPLEPFRHYGWLSLEIAVADVDALGRSLTVSPFEIIGPPADLAMSDAIRAMQVLGPGGEVLYLTQIKRPVPGFDLPQARCPVDRLFIPVMTCPRRAEALARYTALSGNQGLQFDTRITVISRALGLDREHQHPVATLQLAGNTLIEIDQVDGLAPAPFASPNPPTGIALVHFAHAGVPAGAYTGAAGERYLLIDTPRGSLQ